MDREEWFGGKAVLLPFSAQDIRGGLLLTNLVLLQQAMDVIRKHWLLVAPLIVVLTFHRAAEARAAESPKERLPDWVEQYRVKSEPRWALVLALPAGDPVEHSRWYHRETCEMVRESMARTALRTGAAVQGTRCVALTWRTWLRYLWLRYVERPRGRTLDGEKLTDLDFSVAEYLEKAVDLGTPQQDVAVEFGSPRLVKELPTGQMVWTYKARWRMISLGGGKPLTPPHVRCFVLTFDQQKILRKWEDEWRQGDCSGPLVPKS